MLRKKPTYESAAKPLDKLYERMKGHMVDSDSRVPKSSKAGASEVTTEVDSVSYPTKSMFSLMLVGRSDM